MSIRPDFTTEADSLPSGQTFDQKLDLVVERGPIDINSPEYKQHMESIQGPSRLLWDATSRLLSNHGRKKGFISKTRLFEREVKDIASPDTKEKLYLEADHHDMAKAKTIKISFGAGGSYLVLHKGIKFHSGEFEFIARVQNVKSQEGYGSLGPHSRPTNILAIELFAEAITNAATQIGHFPHIHN